MEPIGPAIVRLMKSKLVGTAFGSWLLRVRGKLDLTLAALREPEQTGMLANAYTADLLITRLCKSGMTFVDVGAHIGSVVGDVHVNDRSIKLIAIEADPDKAKALQAKLPNCVIHSCAVGEEPGEVTFYIDQKRPGYSSLAHAEGQAITERTVKLERLDDLLDATDIDTIKMDIEGAELGALMGGEKIITANRPTIMFESGPDDALGFTKEGLWGWFASHGYEVFAPDRLAHTGPPMTLEVFIDSHEFPRRTLNYFAVPSERRTEIRDKARAILGV